MKIECTRCFKAYHLTDEVIYKIYKKKLICTDCGKSNPIENFILDKEALHQFSSGDDLKQEVLKNLKKLYPMPHVILKAKKLISGYGSFRDLEKLLNTDPALAGRVLKIANSAYYGMSRKVSSIQTAATILGTDTLLQILTMVGHSRMLGRTLAGYELNSGALWKHSISVAVCARIIETAIHPKGGEDAFFAGLMHDTGKIILDAYVTERKPLFKRYKALTHASINAAEKRILGFNHADIGYELCRQWNLPEPVATAIKYHHSPTSFGGNRLAYIINLADHMAKTIAAEPGDPLEPPLEALRFLPITESELDGLIARATNAVETLEEDTY